MINFVKLVEEGAKMYCNNCGKKLSKDDFFCSNCGTPVLRQNLFDDQDDDSFADSFEETRLFTAEELGKYLEDVPEENVGVADYNKGYSDKNVDAYQPAQMAAPIIDDVKNLGQNASIENISENNLIQKSKKKIGGFGSFVGSIKERLQDAEASEASQDDAYEEPVYNAPMQEAVQFTESFAEENVAAPQPEKQKNKKEKKPSSFKKIVLPVILLGLIIGFVIGLILVQPWNNGEDSGENQENQDVVAAVAFVEE